MEQNNNIGIVHVPLYKKFWYSITKFEKYPEMAAEGVGRTIGYLAVLILLFAIIVSIGYIIKFNGVNNIIINSLDALDGLEIEQFNKEEFINLINTEINTPQMQIVYGIVMTIYLFLLYFIAALIDILVLSVFGWITTLIAQLKMRYRAVFNMSIYAMTLSTVLQLIYILVRTFTDFNIKYFDLMYTTIAFICLAAAIFMIRSDVIKQQIELMKIIEIKRQQEEQQKEEKKEEKPEEKKEEKPEDKKEEKEEDNPGGNEAEGGVSS